MVTKILKRKVKKVNSANIQSKKKFTRFKPQIFSRHPSHDVLREKDALPLMPFKSVIRFGSTTDKEDTVSNGGNRIEVNTIDAINNSADKSLMKECFHNDAVKTASWWRWLSGNTFSTPDGEDVNISDLQYPIVSKHIHGSRGTGNTLHQNSDELRAWMAGKDLDNYIFEEFYTYNREYRLHVTKDGCFYTCRKLLREGTPENQRWYRNDSNCVWVVENNQSFDKPVNWDTIEQECVKALNAVGLDVGACDVKVQSTRDNRDRIRENPEFIVLEINSAPSFGEITTEKYKEILPEILKYKKSIK